MSKNYNEIEFFVPSHGEQFEIGQRATINAGKDGDLRVSLGLIEKMNIVEINRNRGEVA